MRTVSFSQSDVRKILNQDFVCFHTSTEGDPTAGQSIRHRPNDPAGTCVRGNGKQNVQTIFLTPEGKIFHAVTGFVSPKELIDELRFAKELFDKLRSSGKDSSDSPESIVVDGHRKWLAKAGFSDEQIDSQGTLLGGMALPNLDAIMNKAVARNNGGNSIDSATDLFNAMSRSQSLADHQFCIRNPLMTSEEFESNPSSLVGNEKSFFMSSSSGN